MMNELVEHYGVRNFSAVLKRTNRRSVRLLERLGFSLAQPDQFLMPPIDPDEMLMHRDRWPP
jgi:RimJ/RimL family protein N-acetyltransferase